MNGENQDVRLAELLGVLTLGADLGMQQPMEHVLRQCLIALRLATHHGLDEDEQVVIYYASMLAWLGCHIDAYEQAKWFGDDLTLKGDFRTTDLGGQRAQAAFMLRHLGAGSGALDRIAVGLGFLRTGRRDAMEMIINHWRAADQLASRLGLDAGVRATVEQTFERWDGHGYPRGRKGSDILLSAQLVNLADVVEVYHRLGGTSAAIEVARERSGTQFGPDLVAAFCAAAPQILDGLQSHGWDEVLACEPSTGVRVPGSEVTSTLEAFADFIDLKSPYTIGHSRAVAELATNAAHELGLDRESDGTARVEDLRRAALVHDFGRLGISNAIWDKQAPLTSVERERVRMYPYLTERMLAFSPVLAPLSRIAVQHHERLDGSGYPRGLTAAQLTTESRLLAAADRYRSTLEPRAYRCAATAADAAARLKAAVRAGRLDPEAVHAVLRSAGHRTGHIHRPAPARQIWPDGLTTREVDVLRLLARGLSNRLIAEQLAITPKTVGNHIEHIYAKIGASNRALAALYAARQGLMSG